MRIKSNYDVLTLEEAWVTPEEIIELDFEYFINEETNGEEPVWYDPEITVVCKRRFIEHDDGTSEVIEHETELQGYEFHCKILHKMEVLALMDYEQLLKEEC